MSQQYSRINRPNNKPLILIRDTTSEFHLNSNRDNKDVVTYKPLDQIDLNENELKEDIARVLTATGKNAVSNLVTFNYNKRCYEKLHRLDSSHIHLELKGNFIYRDSEEAKAYEMESKTLEKIKENYYKTQNLIDEYIDANGQRKFRMLKNEFNLIDRSTQTQTYPAREIGCNTDPPAKIIYSGLATQWSIYQAYEEDFQKNEAKTKKTKNTRILSATPAANKKKQPKKIISAKENYTEKLLKSAKMLERMVFQNMYDDVISDFKYYEDPADQFKEKEGTLLPLWKFTNDLIKNMCITGIVWNLQYQDLFAITIGSYNFFEKVRGYILLYSLKNPRFYEYKIETDAGCMCLDFNFEQPNLIAAGYYDGSVAVYDLSDKEIKMDKYKVSPKNTLKHLEPVWQIRWQKNDIDDHPNFCTISSDGYVLIWTIKNRELFSTELVTLSKRSLDEVEENQKAGVKLLDCGTCFDFNTKPDDLFIVGTEEGKAFEYSKIYSSDLLTAFDCHYLPIYAIKWNPFHKKVFLTCSADFTVKIWDHRYADPVFTFELSSAVSDADWAPFSSTVFAAVTTDGNIYIFDLSINSSEPLCCQNVLTKKRKMLTHVSFHPNEYVVLVSDNNGTVASFKLSPNLRSIPNDDKNFLIAVINKQNFEVSKLSLAMGLDKEGDKNYVKSIRKHFDYQEKTIELKSKEEEKEEEKERLRSEKK